MKTRESGMPNEKTWEKFFDVEKILNELEVNSKIEKLVELGFGYGTFTIPASKKIDGVVIGFDIERDLTEALHKTLATEKIENVRLINKDFAAEGTGLQNEETDYVMLFNILHAEESGEILKESYRILKPNGKIGVIHWNYDPATPRGPSMSIRPKPEQLRKLLTESGFGIAKSEIDLPPHHYGILGVKEN